jgi:hypothetical protein
MQRLVVIVVVCAFCIVAVQAKRQIYEIDTSWVCDVYAGKQDPNVAILGYHTELLLHDMTCIFNQLQPSHRITLFPSYDTTEVRLERARYPQLARYNSAACPNALYFAWTDTEMRAHWRCHLDGTAEGDYDTCATPPLKASSSEQ